MTPDAPGLGINRLMLVVTGSASASDLPLLVSWLRTQYPAIELRVVMTRAAGRFVAPAAVSGRVGSEVLRDEWPTGEWRARHVEWAEWAEAIVVYPATLAWMARLALGMADSPALLAAQCTKVPVVLAPALPPGGLESAAYQAHWAALTARQNVAVAPPRPGTSQTTGRVDAWIPAPMPQVLELVEACRSVVP